MFVGIVQVSDIDNGMYVKLVYFIVFGENSNYFLIYFVEGILYIVVVLDREIVKEYRIKVKVLDFVVFFNDLFNVINVYIIVFDQNDNNLSFFLLFYNVFVLENFLFGILVIMVMVDDCDIDVNVELMYSIFYSFFVEYFSIDSVIGEVMVKNVFDYEVMKVINVIIIVYDNGIIRLSGFVFLVIYIEDVNDNNFVIERGQ